MGSYLRLTGDALAEAYTALLKVRFPCEPGGKVWATNLGGGWIEMQGTKLSPHPDMRKQHPHGWELLDRIRASAVRRELIVALGGKIKDPF